MIQRLLSDKPWAQEWPHVIQEGYDPLTELHFDESKSSHRMLSTYHEPWKKVVQAFMGQDVVPRQEVLRWFKSIEQWSNQERGWTFPVTPDNWEEQCVELCRQVEKTPDPELWNAIWFVALCYPSCFVRACQKQRDLKGLPAVLAQVVALSLSERSMDVASSEQTFVREEWTEQTSKNNNTSNKAEVKEVSSLVPSKSETPKTESFKPSRTALSLLLEEWTKMLKTEQWSEARAREWLDGQLKQVKTFWFESEKSKHVATYGKNDEVWTALELYPALVQLKSDDVRTLIHLWPLKPCAMQDPQLWKQQKWLWGILKQADDRLLFMESVLPCLFQLGHLPVLTRREIGEEMLRLARDPEEFKQRLSVWMSWGGDMHARPQDTHDQADSPLFSPVEVKTVPSLYDWMKEQSQPHWQEVLEEMNHKPLKNKYKP